jgi:hypothetical protein
VYQAHGETIQTVYSATRKVPHLETQFFLFNQILGLLTNCQGDPIIGCYL